MAELLMDLETDDLMRERFVLVLKAMVRADESA
jgi:hypothetical protein